jgi:lipopolysaccharide/colanic/teichoic acid biosynthesis glycosyltransferase
LSTEAFGLGEPDVAIALPGNATPEVVPDATDLVYPFPDAEAIASDPTDGTTAGGLLAAAWWQLTCKRAIDVVGSVTLLVLLLPVLFLTALAIRATSPGPALYRQERVGRGGRTFKILKFRSMHVGAHEVRSAIAHRNETTGPVFKMRKDPRLTTVGRFIRRLSIDEVPQLLNVLRGDMSLVGPRPPLPEEFSTYGPRECERLRVLPGLTCIWQVSGRSDLDFETWVDMDIEYIRTWTLRRDLALLARTIPAVFTGRGAY